MEQQPYERESEYEQNGWRAPRISEAELSQINFEIIVEAVIKDFKPFAVYDGSLEKVDLVYDEPQGGGQWQLDASINTVGNNPYQLRLSHVSNGRTFEAHEFSSRQGGVTWITKMGEQTLFRLDQVGIEDLYNLSDFLTRYDWRSKYAA